MLHPNLLVSHTHLVTKLQNNCILLVPIATAFPMAANVPMAPAPLFPPMGNPMSIPSLFQGGPPNQSFAPPPPQGVLPPRQPFPPPPQMMHVRYMAIVTIVIN